MHVYRLHTRFDPFLIKQNLLLQSVALWPMPAWVWRDVLLFIYFFLYSMRCRVWCGASCDILVHGFTVIMMVSRWQWIWKVPWHKVLRLRLRTQHGLPQLMHIKAWSPSTAHASF